VVGGFRRRRASWTVSDDFLALATAVSAGFRGWLTLLIPSVSVRRSVGFGLLLADTLDEQETTLNVIMSELAFVSRSSVAARRRPSLPRCPSNRAKELTLPPRPLKAARIRLRTWNEAQSNCVRVGILRADPPGVRSGATSGIEVSGAPAPVFPEAPGTALLGRHRAGWQPRSVPGSGRQP
jgi:hypothetical protein